MDKKLNEKILKDCDVKKQKIISDLPQYHDFLKKIRFIATYQNRNINKLDLSEDITYEDIDVQLIFPSVNIEAIKAVKKHPLINKEKTCHCQACIRVFLS